MQDAPCGSWASPFSAESIARGGRKLMQPTCRHGAIWWLEGLPEEGGRLVLRRHLHGRIRTLTPESASVRTRAREYGGGAWCSPDADSVYYVNDADQGIYRFRAEDSGPAAVRVRDGERFGDLQWDAAHGRILAVREELGTEPEPRESLVAITPENGAVTELASGADFHAAPRVSPDGRQLAWVSWNHPDMPWDRTDLWLAPLDASGLPGEAQRLTGDDAEAVFQPEWEEDGSLLFISDRDTGWWNLWRYRDGQATPVTERTAELGLPWWQFGMQSWALFAPGRAIAAETSAGVWQVLRIEGEQITPLNRDWTAIRHVAAGGGRAVMLAARPDHPLAVVAIDPESGETEVLATAAPVPDEPRWISRPESRFFPTAGGQQAHALFYPPCNPDYRPAGEERPPVLIQCHGGPTGATDNGFDPGIQFWTSRGIAVADLNYRGSTGFGRAYRESLYGGWGETDLADAVALIEDLAGEDRVDPGRALISGSSAGGYSVLAGLAFTDAFAAGASHYGVSDLRRLDQSTHKFESRYLEKLIGPWPQARATWEARSPIHHAEDIRAPVIFFQGDEDRVVPPDQARDMAATLEQAGLPVACVIFAGEGHGFRRFENIRDALAMELHFYGRVLGFAPADPAPELEIRNL